MVFNDIIIVFILGLLTAIATGLGAIPFFFTKKLKPQYNSGLYGLAIGVMLSASVLGLIPEGLKVGTFNQVLIGVTVGVLFLVLANRMLPENHHLYEKITGYKSKSLFIIIGALTIHSFPEGFAIGTSYASSYELALLMFIAIAIHNIPEGVSVSIPLAAQGASKWRMVSLSIFTSLPQPIGAVIAYILVKSIEPLLPISFGFAAGAMVAMIIKNMLPEAKKTDHNLYLFVGFVAGFVGMYLLILSI